MLHDLVIIKIWDASIFTVKFFLINLQIFLKKQQIE
jgi:hypothetical protein